MFKSLHEKLNPKVANLFQAEPAGDHIGPGRFLWVVGLIGLIGVGLRLWNLHGASIWMDEAVTLGLSRLPVETILFDKIDNHPPLSFLIQHYWMQIAPDVSLARVPSAIFGGATLLVMIGLLRDQVSRPAAILGGLLFAFSTAHIFYSQDLRMYAILILGVALGSWGAMGLANPKQYALRIYSLLYIFGAAIAIYSHAIGLVCMALIGGASLLSGYLSERRWDSVKRWFLCNLAVLVLVLPWLIQIPGASSSFGGLGSTVSVVDGNWFYRNAIGFPGLDKVGTVMEFAAILIAAIGTALAFWHRRWTLAFILLGLVIVYPAILMGLHLRQSILSTRTMLPATIGVTIALAYALCAIKQQLARRVLIGVFVASAIGSSVMDLANRVKLEQNRDALTFAEANGFADAPILTCHVYTAAALWEEGPDEAIYFSEAGTLLEYQGPDYWQVASESMNVLREMSQIEIDAYLGGGWIVDGGLETLLAAHSSLTLVRSFCPAEELAFLEETLADAGFEDVARLDMRESQDGKVVIINPQTVVDLYKISP